MKKNHAFTPSLDGKLEDRLVLNGARASAVLLAQQHNGDHNGWGGASLPRSAILTTRTYHMVLVNIHRSVELFGRSHGLESDYARLSHNLGRQLQRIPYARASGLTEYIQSSLTLYSPQESHILYGDIRSTVVGHLAEQVYDGNVGIHKSPGHYFSDSDIYGPHALIFQPV